jgi:2-aminobenzoylacetyl-CoA thioesterase
VGGSAATDQQDQEGAARRNIKHPMLDQYADNLCSTTGYVANGLYVCGLTWSSVYLLVSSRPIIFEAGFACAAGMYEKDLNAFLDNGRPEALFITHGHWDHCGSASYLQRTFPGLKIGASPETESIISRPSAQKLMTELGAIPIPTLLDLLPQDDAARVQELPFEPFHIDMPVEDKQTISIAPDLTVQAFYTPGHTRDHVSYYVPERKILFGGEAAGCLEPLSGISVEFLIDYDVYVKSLRRLMDLPAEIYCLSHHYVLLGNKTIKDFLSRSLEATERFCQRIYDLLDREGNDVERVLEVLAAEYRITDPGVQQPVEAYLINQRARVEHLKQKKQRVRENL